jgi:hypothetical protein
VWCGGGKAAPAKFFSLVVRGYAAYHKGKYTLSNGFGMISSDPANENRRSPV